MPELDRLRVRVGELLDLFGIEDEGEWVGKFDEDDLPWASILALDPGGTTGWSVMCVDPAALSDPAVMILDSIYHWSQGQIEGDTNTQTDEIAELFDAWHNTPVVLERFILRKFLKSEELLSPVRVSACVEYLAARGGYGRRKRYAPRPYVYQNVDAAKRTATDDRLKDWGLYLADGQQHARDATRHAITLLRAAKEQRHAGPGGYWMKQHLWQQWYGAGAPFAPSEAGRRASGTGRQA